ncbi:MAG: carboxypeptidase-like regulatory domain-containing protein [Terriglobales bacterium]
MKFGVIIFSVLLFATGEVRAQSDRASITGTVRDAGGAVIPGAQITVTGADNAIRAAADTNALGVYTLLNLPIGQYTVTCSKDGFGKYQRSGVNLAISQVAEIDVLLMIGTSTETTTVTASGSPQISVAGGHRLCVHR